MEKWIEHAKKLKNNADLLLEKMNLKVLLSKYGQVFFTGSYDYDVMTWPDIDICLATPSIKIEKIFDLGKEIALFPNVITMYYRNELILQTSGNPTAIFWCIEIKNDPDPIWKIDILIALKEEVERICQLGQAIKSKITSEKRNQILAIKYELSKTPEYRREYRSTDIYHAVLEDGITSFTEWQQWWFKKKE